MKGEDGLRLHIEYGSTYEIEHIDGETEPDDGGPPTHPTVPHPD